ncbi:MAG: hypothetical protein WCS89_03515 [Candidatus Paceibacterota bacterium]|jgi:hypothetical protein
MKEIHFRRWLPSDRKALERARSFKTLSLIALDVMSRIRGDIEMVSGPISTGGVGTLEGNRRVFEKTIEILINEQRNLFSQMPFEDKMVELYKIWHTEHPTEKYCLPILDHFYEVIFSQGRVTKLNFIFGWESSFGARWEHDNCNRWKIEREYLPEEFSRKVLVL